MPWQQRVRPLPVGLHGPEAEDIKVCPRCGAFIMKINDGSCNRVSCTVCGCLLCWLCLREISDVRFLRCSAGAGRAACRGASLSPAASSCLSLCPPSSRLEPACRCCSPTSVASCCCRCRSRGGSRRPGQGGAGERDQAEGVDIEVEVEIEPGREQSRCSAPSGQSLAGGSPGGPAERGHRGRGPGSTEREPL
ncbi:uncharacterized protein LOC112992617 isoform X5 [Dromaius novaehollandiae]|uniref:uncharacterized protein LOC112992617 isoform X5 n=1 Tax=Dromaius novaehollandiae TaxID=8790 RepID=UPI00311D8DFD